MKLKNKLLYFRVMNMQLANTLQGILPMDEEFFLQDSSTNAESRNIHGLGGSSRVCYCFLLIIENYFLIFFAFMLMLKRSTTQLLYEFYPLVK